MTAMRTRAVACLVAIGAVVLTQAATASAAPSAREYHSAVRQGVLPEWARTGFSDPRPRLPHVMGRSGEIAALVFG